MIKCANCDANAEYTYVVNQETLINYCEKDLPSFLLSRKTSGDLALVTPAIVEEPVKSSKKKKDEPVVEDAPEEVAEETTEPVTE